MVSSYISDIFAPDVPKASITETDPQTKELVNQAYDRSQQAPDQLRGVNDAANQSFGSDNQAYQSEQQRGGLMDPNLVSAIRSKYGSILGQNLTSMKNQDSINSYSQRADRLKFAQNALVAQQKVENSNYQRLLAATNNENEIKAGVIKSWMSLGGAVVGGIFGGPAGAGAGSQLGGKPGEMEDVRPSGGGYSTGRAPTQNDYMNSGVSYSAEGYGSPHSGYRG